VLIHKGDDLHQVELNSTNKQDSGRRMNQTWRIVTQLFSIVRKNVKFEGSSEFDSRVRLTLVRWTFFLLDRSRISMSSPFPLIAQLLRMRGRPSST
jgi:hypothetical protein